MTRICILGGGFGGLYTALNLARLPWPHPPDIVLVDRSDRFVFSPLLYELLSGEVEEWEIAPPFAELLEGTGIQFVRGTVTGLDLGDRMVSVTREDASASLTYDRLVLALGGVTPLGTVPGAADHALPFRTLEDARRLEQRLQALERSNREKIRVCVVGGGPSGVELACTLADRLKERGRVRIVDRHATLLPQATAANRKAAERALMARGVWIDLLASVSQVTATEIALDYTNGSDVLPVDIVMWTVGNALSDLVAMLPLPHDAKLGQITVSPTLQVQDRPELFAVGDLANCRDASDRRMPATAQVAFQQAQYCAWNLWASVVGQPLVPFRYIPFGELYSLGRENGAVSLFGQLSFDGYPAHALRRLAYLLRLPTFKHQLKVGLNWASKPAIAAIARLMA